MLIKPKQRRSDKWGSGHFGASRGSRTHNGIDFSCDPETEVFSHIYGEITKLGYPYGDDLSFRYVEIQDENGYYHRFFYVDPCVKVGDVVSFGQLIGSTQKLNDRYPGITEHFHYEVIQYQGKEKLYFNPENFMVS